MKKKVGRPKQTHTKKNHTVRLFEKDYKFVVRYGNGLFSKGIERMIKETQNG